MYIINDDAEGIYKTKNQNPKECLVFSLIAKRKPYYINLNDEDWHVVGWNEVIAKNRNEWHFLSLNNEWHANTRMNEAKFQLIISEFCVLCVGALCEQNNNKFNLLPKMYGENCY